MRDLIVAFGLVLIIEGLIYAFAPRAVRRMLELVDELGPDRVRTGALLAVALGVVVVWVGRRAFSPS